MLIPNAGEARRGGVFLAEKNQKRIPLPPQRSKLWSAHAGSAIRRQSRDFLTPSLTYSCPAKPTQNSAGGSTALPSVKQQQSRADHPFHRVNRCWQ
jgi:hypothetical protein